MKKLNIMKQIAAITFASAIALTTQAKANCWTAGAIDGSCQTKENINIDPTTTYGGRCWTAGAFNNMCYSKPSLIVEAEKK